MNGQQNEEGRRQFARLERCRYTHDPADLSIKGQSPSREFVVRLLAETVQSARVRMSLGQQDDKATDSAERSPQDGSRPAQRIMVSRNDGSHAETPCG
jgi:hypothetical protein